MQNYKINIVLSGEMAAKSEIEAVKKLSLMVDTNPLFRSLSEVFKITIDRDSIIGENDDKINEEFSVCEFKSKEDN